PNCSFALKFGEARPDIERHRFTFALETADNSWKILSLQITAATLDHRPLNRVTQLSDIAGPLVRAQSRPAFLVHPQDFDLRRDIELRDELFRQQFDVFLSFA